MKNLTRRNFMRGTLIGIIGAPALLANKSEAKSISKEKPANTKTNTEKRESKLNTVEPKSFLYNCFMEIQRFNYERGMMSKERYDKIRNSPVVSQKVGRRIYFGSAQNQGASPT